MNNDNTTPSGDAPNTEDMTLALSKDHPDIEGYKIVGLLGEGGMGRVYLAEDVTLKRRVAIKIMSQRLSRDADAHARFLREARTMATVEHPNIVRIYGFGSCGEEDYLVMEYVEGESLSQRIRREGVLSVDSALTILGQTIDALNEAWSKGVIHRDIKPANILLDKNGRVRVADFGLAKSLQLEDSTTLTKGGHILGTPQYISPEQARGDKEIDFRSDIYSLGIVLYEMLTGEPPYRGKTPYAVVEQHLNTPLPSPQERRSDLPATVTGLPGWMTEKDRAERPESYLSLKKSVDALLSGESVAADYDAARRRAPGKLFTPTRIALLGVLVLVLVWAAAATHVRHLREQARQSALAVQRMQDEFRLVIAPFYSATETAREEGEVMRQLLFSAITDALEGEKGVRVLTPTPQEAPRTEDDAVALGEPLYADTIVWGRVVSLRGETIIEPKVTVLSKKQKRDASRDLIGQGELGVEALTTSESETNILETRTNKAKELAELGVVLAARHLAGPSFSGESKRRAIQLLEPIDTPESHYIQGQVLLWSDQLDQGIEHLERAVQLRPDYVPAILALAQANSRVAYWIPGRTNLENAFKWYQRWFDLDPTYYSRYSWSKDIDFGYLYLMYEATGELKKANDVLTTVSRIWDSDDYPPTRILTILDWKGRTDEVEGLLKIGGDLFQSSYRLRLMNDYGFYENAVTSAPSVLEQAQVKSEDSVANTVWVTEDYVSALCATGKCDDALRVIDETEEYCEANVASALDRFASMVSIAIGLKTEDPYWSKGRTRTIMAWRNELDQMRSWVRLNQSDSEMAFDLLAGTKVLEGVSCYESLTGQEARALIEYSNGEYGKVVDLLAEHLQELAGMYPRRIGCYLLAMSYLRTGDPEASENVLGLVARGVRTRRSEWSQKTGTQDPRFKKIVAFRYDPFELFVAVKDHWLSEAEAFAYSPIESLGWQVSSKRLWDVQLNYFFGENAAAQGDLEKARALLKTAVATEMRHAVHWMLAKAALERLSATQE